MLVGLQRHQAAAAAASLQHQLKALYRCAGGFDRPADTAAAETSSHGHAGIRSPVSHVDTLQSHRHGEPSSAAYDQLLLQTATTAPISQPPQPADAACGFDGLAVISFHCPSPVMIRCQFNHIPSAMG